MDPRQTDNSISSPSRLGAGISLLVVSVFGLAASGHAYAAGSPVVAVWLFVAVLVLVIPGYVMAFGRGDKLREDLYGNRDLATGADEEGKGARPDQRERPRDLVATALPRSLGPHGLPGLPAGVKGSEQRH